VFSDVFEDLVVGDVARSRGRTLTETDVVNFCGLTGNWLAIHSDAEFSRSSRFGQRVVQGGLVFVIGNALFGYDEKVIAAFYGVDNLRFIRPTFIGDTIHSVREITQLRAKDDHHGVASAKLEVRNQRNETVLACDFRVLVFRRAGAPRPLAARAAA
jgi:acyl dehydratase